MAKNDIIKAGNFRLSFKDQSSLEFFIQEANLPGFQLGEIPIGAHLAQQERRPGDHIQWNNLILQVICDEDMKAFEDCRRYIMTAKDPETGAMDNDYIYFQGTLVLTTNKNNSGVTYKFENCWIQSVSDLAFSTTTGEDDPITFSVEVIYTHYKLWDPAAEKEAKGIT